MSGMPSAPSFGVRILGLEMGARFLGISGAGTVYYGKLESLNPPFSNPAYRYASLAEAVGAIVHDARRTINNWPAPTKPTYELGRWVQQPKDVFETCALELADRFVISDGFSYYQSSVPAVRVGEPVIVGHNLERAYYYTDFQRAQDAARSVPCGKIVPVRLARAGEQTAFAPVSNVI